MVAYTKKRISKQIVRTKYIRFGYKSCVFSSNDGYPYFFYPYCRAKDGDGKVSKHLCACSCLSYVKNIGNCTNKEVYFGSWFSWFSLLRIMKDK